MPQQLLSQRPIIEQYLEDNPQNLSGFSFTNIFAWQEFFHFDIKIIRDSLCIFARNETGCFLYLPPLGKNVTAPVIEECFNVMEDINQGSGVTRIENVCTKQLALFPEEEFVRHKKGYEYCYYKEDITTLRGNPYKSKRSSYNQFTDGYSHKYLAYEEGMREDCIALYRRWAEGRKKNCSNDIYRHMLEENEEVHASVLKHYRALGLVGRVVTIDGQVKAYSFGFAVNRDMFCILFEIADLDIKGLPVYIFREFCRDVALQPYKFINVMDDFELNNIRQTKMSFRPLVLLPSYVVTKKYESISSQNF